MGESDAIDYASGSGFDEKPLGRTRHERFACHDVTFSGIMKLTGMDAVLEGFAKLGYPAGLVLGIGIVEIACVVLYVIPRTAVLGAILVTGYLGGAFATHVRIGDPLFSQAIGPFYLGVLVWGGICLRDERLRALIPVRS